MGENAQLIKVLRFGDDENLSFLLFVQHLIVCYDKAALTYL